MDTRQEYGSELLFFPVISYVKAISQLLLQYFLIQSVLGRAGRLPVSTTHHSTPSFPLYRGFFPPPFGVETCNIFIDICTKYVSINIISQIRIPANAVQTPPVNQRDSLFPHLDLSATLAAILLLAAFVCGDEL